MDPPRDRSRPAAGSATRARTFDGTEFWFDTRRDELMNSGGNLVMNSLMDTTDFCEISNMSERKQTVETRSYL